MRIKIDDKIYRLKEIESGVDSLMELVEEPRYRDGDFLKSITGSLFIHNGKYEYDNVCAHFYISGLNQRHKYDCKVCWEDNIDGFCSPEEVDMIHNELGKDGKRWNSDKKCVEDIPKRKFKAGDKVTLKSGCISKPNLEYLPFFDKYIGERLEVVSYTKYGNVLCNNNYYFYEDWLEPWSEEKLEIENIPQHRFKAGDKVKIKDGISSKTHSGVGQGFVDTMDKFIGKELTVGKYNSRGFVVFYEDDYGYRFAEDWLEPWSDEPKIGDWVIYWDRIRTARVGVLTGIRSNKGCNYSIDNGGWWEHAVKWDGIKNHIEKVRRGEI